VAHPLLDAADVGDADDPRPERVAEVVEAERSQCGSIERGAVALRERRTVEVAADDPEKTSSSSSVKYSRWPSRASASATFVAIGTERTLPDFGVVRRPFV
jgi:hypothetical protein